MTDKYGVPMAQSRMSGVHSAPLGRSHVMPRKPLVNPKVSPHKNTNPKSGNFAYNCDFTSCCGILVYIFTVVMFAERISLYLSTRRFKFTLLKYDSL